MRSGLGLMKKSLFILKSTSCLLLQDDVKMIVFSLFRLSFSCYKRNKRKLYFSTLYTLLTVIVYI